VRRKAACVRGGAGRREHELDAAARRNVKKAQAGEVHVAMRFLDASNARKLEGALALLDPEGSYRRGLVTAL
jgi:hypothetical protein